MEIAGMSVATLLRLKAEKLITNRPDQFILNSNDGEILKLLHELELYSVELEVQNEELLKTSINTNESSDKFKFSDTIRQRLLHEFEVNKVELEIQNDELLLSSIISKDVAERYSDLFNFSSSGYMILSPEGEIIDVNFTGAKLLGKKRFDLKNSCFGFFVSENDRQIYNDFLEDIFKHKSKITCEVSVNTENTTPIYVLLSGILTQQEDQCLITMADITERKQSTKYRDLTREILQLLNEPGDIKESLHRTLAILKERTGFDAVGIRLQEGTDFPYLEQTGFSADFMLKENTLIERDKGGKICRDKNGNVSLGCTCGLVISGSAKPTNPNVTQGGSWWTNNSLPFLKVPQQEDERFQPRNECIHEGYSSIALIPLRANDKIVGLIQFNNYRCGVFNQNKIEMLEGIASHIGAALMRKQAEGALRKNEELLRTITEHAPDIILQLDQHGTILYMNRPVTGYTLEESIGKNFCTWTLPEYHDLMNRSLQLVFKASTTHTYLSQGNDIQGELRWYRTSISPVKEGEVVINAILITRDITDSISSEEILRESEQKRKTILMTAMDGFWISDLMGSILEVNDTYSRMIGYTRQELLTMRIQELEVAETSEETSRHIKKIMKLGEDRFETRHRCKNGRIIEIEASVQYRKEQGGQFMAFLHDITERKQREESLRQSEIRQRLLSETMLQGVVHQDAEGNIILMNPAAERILGKTKDRFLGSNSVEEERDTIREDGSIFPGGEHPAMVSLRTGSSLQNVIMGVYHPTLLEYRWISIDSVPLFRNGEKKPYEVYTIFEDITERRQSEEIINYHAGLLENISDAVISTDENFRIKSWNAGAEKIYGWKKEEVIGTFITDFLQTQYPDQTSRKESLDRLHALSIWQGDVIQQRKDHTKINILSSVKELKDKKGAFIGSVIVNRDITDRMKAEERLKESEERYKSLFKDNHSVMLILHPETGEIVDANPAACQYYGWSYSELCHKKISEINTLSPAEITNALHNSRIQKSNHLFFNHRVASGEIRNVEVYSGPILYNDSTMLYSIIHDITESKRLEEELQKSRIEMEAALASMTDAVFISDIAGRFINFNDAFATYHKFGSKAECAKAFDEYPDVLDVYIADGTLVPVDMWAVPRALRGEKLSNVVYTLKRKDTGVTWIGSYSFAPIRNKKGKIVGSVVVARDITESKLAEKELQKSKDNLRAILDATLESIYLFDKDGTIVDANVTAAKRLNMDLSEISGQNFTAFIPEKNQGSRLHYLAEVFATGEPLQFEDRRDNYIFEHNFFPVFNQDNVEHVVSFSRDITMSRKLEDSLKESEKKYRELVKYAPTGIYEVDMKTLKFVTINDVMTILSGYSQEELFSMHMLDILAGESKNLFKSRIEMLLKGELPNENVEYEIKAKDGHIIYATLDVKFTFDEEGVAIGATVIGHDITERVKMEEVLRVSEQKLSEIYASMSEGLAIHELIFDSNGKAIDYLIVEVNPAYEKITGIHQQDVVNRKATELYSQEEAPYLDVYAEVACTNVSRTFETYFAPMNKYFSISVFSPGKGRFVTVFRDVTIQMKAEKALKDSEEKFSLIYEKSPYAISLSNLAEGRIIDVNEAFENIFGLLKSEVVGKRTDELGLNMNLELREDILSDIRNKGFAHDIESVFYTRAGEKRILRYNIDIVESGNQKYLLNTADDITTRKEIEEALKESEYFFRESQQAGFIGSYKTDFETGKWESSEVLDEIFGIDNTYNRNVEGWLAIAHPDDREMMNHYLSEEVLMKGQQFNKEYRIVRKNDHKTRWVHGLGRVDFDSNHVVKSLVGTIQDITERKAKEETLRKLNKTLAAMSKSSMVMSQSREEAEYLQQVCDIVVEDTDFAMVWIGYAEDNEAKTIRPMASAGFSDDYLNSIKLSWGDNEYGRGPTGVAIRTGKMGICSNMFTEPTFVPWRDQALRRGYASSIVFPLKTENKIFGAIMIYSKEPESFLEDEIKLLSKLANDLGHGITTIRLRKARELAEEALQKSHNELEMTVKIRTAELIETNEALRHTEEKYRTVSDFATNWEFWIAPDDRMIYCSPSCERITGYTSVEFEQNPYLIFDIIHSEDLQMYQRHKNKELKGHVCEHEIQYRIHKKDGIIRWIGHFCRPVFDDSGEFRGVRGSNKDITSRKKMEELLTTSNQKYKLLSENINDGIFICKNGKFEYANNAINEIFGYDGSEMEQMKLTELIMADNHEELENLLYSNSPSNKSCNVEVECLRKDFSTVFVEILLNYVAKDKTVYGVVHDITEKKEFQKTMVKAIIQTEERERAYFSKELHDGLGPLLSTIKLYLQWSERPNTNKSREEIIGKAGEILEEALATVKEVSNKLSPHLLTNYGLNSAIKSFVEKLNATASYNIVFESNTTRRLGAETEASLYRAVIECINNTLKYAHANNIYIKLEDTGSQIKLHYYDDGKGFNMQETIAEHKGLGLFNLQNRLHTIGGKVELNSEPGNGVNYLFTVNI